jgi:subtilisin family serine protease
MKLATSLVLLITMVLPIQAALAGAFSPGLEAQVQGLRGSDQIKVLVVLRDQADIATMDWDLHNAKATRADRHQAVLGALQQTARASQGNLITDLDARQGRGEIAGFTPHWLVNAIVVRGTIDALRAIAAREDVLTIEPDLVVELIEPVPNAKPGQRDDTRGIGITPGVQAIQADRVWSELGINGAGTIVGTLDTGVDGNHPALASRWQGLVAPPSTAWLDAAGLGDPNFPADGYGHGTHTMGTITGLALDDTVGVAPGARWIATNAINMSTGPAFDNAVIASFEFMADPDGNPFTTADVPCVVQNSWGVNENFSGYFDCDSRWWAAIDNCEAAGVVVTWSAGNEGPGGTSMRSPADRALTPYNCFSVGSTVTYAPYTISDFSSRGPSGCGGAFAMKPEVSAPGEDVYSSVPGGGYEYYSGTSMAGPHVAGIVSLMCSANPNLDVITIKQVLMDTALDLGTPGEDNTYGHGFVNAYDAVLAVMGGLGTVQGTVTDVVTGLPLAGVTVRVINRPNVVTTNAAGYYSVILPADTYTLTFDVFAYAHGTLGVTVPEDVIVDGSVALSPLPSAVLSGFVHDYTGAIVVGASVRALNTPVPPAVTDATGFYSLNLPSGATYDVLARAVGFGAALQTVNMQGNTTANFVLPELTAEDFEGGNFLQYPWEMSGNAPWLITTTAPYEGTYSARSGIITHNQQSNLFVTAEVTTPADMTFFYKVSSEANYDYLRFSVDGVVVASWSGTVPWTEYTYPATVGTHTFQWAYTKDGSVNTGDDAAYIDFIVFPPLGELPYATLVMDATGFDVNVSPGDVAQRQLEIGNVGTGDLDYLISVQYNPGLRAAPMPTAPLHQVAKDEKDPYEGTAPITNGGGPDAFGYTWKDSNEPGGPTYNWVDISGVGTVPGAADDANYGPFNLGFSFPFYGQNYSQVRICTNGWVSFTSTSTSYSNQSIPLTDEPNALLAGFWDDLYLPAGGALYYYADAANQRFIVQWQAVQHFSSGNPETFEIIINADGTIVYQYATVSLSTGCTVGIENPAGNDGLQVLYNAGGYLTGGKAIRFAQDPTVTWLTVVPNAGAVVPGSSVMVDVNFDATELPAGEYTANLLVGTNDPQNPLVTLPVVLLVGGSTAVNDLPGSIVFHGAAPNPFNPQTTITFSLPASARASLRIYDVSGRLVRSLLDEVRPAGTTEVRWNGADDAGRGVASGTYFARLGVDGQHSVRSLVLVR